MADAATMTLKAVLLPDEIQATLKDLTFSYTPANSSEKWFYGLINVQTSSTNLISGNFIETATSAGRTAGGTPDSITTLDKVKFLFIKHTETTNGSSASNESVYLGTDGSAVAHSSTNVIEIGPAESWYAKLPNTTVGDLNVISGDSNGSATGDYPIQCIVAAIIDDV